MSLAEERARTVEVRPNPSGFGAEITGLDLSRPLPADVLETVKAAWAAHQVVWFPDQPLDHDQLEAFTLQIGPFGDGPFVRPLPGRPHIIEVRRDPDEKASPFGAAWHSDWSFQERPPSATILHAKVVPPVGGDTMFSDGCAAFEALDPAMQARLSGLRGIHSAARPYAADGFYANENAPRSMTIEPSDAALASRAQPLVRTHPVSGRKALFVNPVYTVGIEGMDEAEASNLLDALYGHMIEQRFVYRHRWSPDMLIMWDNRTVMHNAMGGYNGHLRLMHRTTVAGEIPV